MPRPTHSPTSLLLLGVLSAFGAMASCRLTESLDDFTSGEPRIFGAGGSGLPDSGLDGAAGDAQVQDSAHDSSGTAGGSGSDGGAGASGTGGSSGSAGSSGSGGLDGGSDANGSDASQPACSLGSCSGACSSCDGNSANGCETDTDSNSSHCGVCGHSCQGAPCVGGSCQPVSLATGLNTPWGIVADESNAYWTEEGSGSVPSGSLSSVPVKGGSSKTLLVGQYAPLFIAADDTYLFWANFANGGSINRVKKSDGTAFKKLTDANSPAGIALASDSVVYSSGTSIWKIPKDGGSAQVLATQTGMNPKGVAIDSTGVYWADVGLSAIMFKPSSGAAKSLVGQQKYPLSVVVDDIYVYWANAGTFVSGECSTSDGSIMRANKDGSNPITIATAQACPQGLLLAGTRLYWTNLGTKHASYDLNGAIMTATVLGGSIKSLATGQSKPWGIAANKTFLFWTNQGVFSGEGSAQRVPLL